MVDIWLMIGFGLTHIFSTCAFFLFLFFFRKLLHIRTTSREILPFLGLMIVFLVISVGFMMFSWVDYVWWENPSITTQIYQLQNICGLVVIGSFAGLTFLIEVRLRKTKYIFTLYMVIGIAILSILSAHEDFILYVLIYLGPTSLAYIPLWYFVYIRPTSGFLRWRMVLALLGLVFIMAGILGRFQFMTELLGTYIYPVGTSLGILGISLIGYGFAAFSTFSDLNWQEKLREIFVISPNGICLYAFSFEQRLPVEDSDLIAGGFSGIQSILSEMVKTSESLHLIDYEDVKIMLEQGTDATFVLIIKDQSSFLKYKLKAFADEFRKFFETILPNWNGDIGVFKPTSTLIHKIFELKP